MYCPSCGAESSLDLNYCNRCGANMVQTLAPPPQFAPIDITKPAVVIGLITVLLTLGGFGVLSIAAYNLAQVIPRADPIIAMMFLGMTTIMISDVILLRSLSRPPLHPLRTAASAIASRGSLPGATRSRKRPSSTVSEPVTFLSATS